MSKVTFAGKKSCNSQDFPKTADKEGDEHKAMVSLLYVLLTLKEKSRRYLEIICSVSEKRLARKYC